MREVMCRLLAAAVLTSATVGVTACHHHRHEGPAEHAGRHIDNGLDKAGDAVENAGRKVNRALPGD